MWTASDIRRLIRRKAFDEMFTTRDFLRWGSRAAVDKALSRMVKSGIIKRLARGVFARDEKRAQNFSDEQIAAVKAVSFGRLITRHHRIVPRTADGQTLKQVANVFLIDGRSSKFTINERTVIFTGIPKRRMALAPSKAGEAISALWHLRKQGFSSENVQRALSGLNRRDKESIWTEMRWMPSWLKDGFKNLNNPLKPRSQW